MPIPPNSAQSAKPVTQLQTTPINFKGSQLASFILRMAGWKYAFNGLPGKVGVVMAYPHTSNWDFPVGLLFKWSTGMPVRFLIKDIFFKIPLVGRCIGYWGGIPVDRSRTHGLSDNIAAQIQEAKDKDQYYWLAIAPEGTRKYMPYLRSGFYQIALAANAPLGLSYFNFRDRIVELTEFITLTGDEAKDVARIAAYYDAHAFAYHPKQAGAIHFKDKSNKT